MRKICNQWFLLSIMMVGMLGFGFTSCGDDDDDDAEETTKQGKVHLEVLYKGMYSSYDQPVWVSGTGVTSDDTGHYETYHKGSMDVLFFTAVGTTLNVVSCTAIDSENLVSLKEKGNLVGEVYIAANWQLLPGTSEWYYDVTNTTTRVMTIERVGNGQEAVMSDGTRYSLEIENRNGDDYVKGFLNEKGEREYGAWNGTDAVKPWQLP